ncbi:MAG: UDP-N-acetylglucosamine 1-carboxyvinyltransferase [Ruminococcaceae bacterium]|nr:UDP-N-acetylglucosamine 1-carboxyvinyltransferase [Oscillospiraceae bacterium]
MRISVNGGKQLCGEIPISGMKNAVLPILFATVLIDGVCVIENIPDISDVENSLKILTAAGAKITKLGSGILKIDTRNINSEIIVDKELMGTMRASYYLLGALLGRFGKASGYSSGGCKIGERPINYHLAGFEALGAKAIVSDELVELTTSSPLKGNIIDGHFSVGSTMNIAMAAVHAEGTTTIINAAREPHVVDFANFLNVCGANIVGAGTSTIKIKGVEGLHSPVQPYTVIPDMIEAGTFMCAAGMVDGSRITVKNVIPKHMESTVAVLKKIGLTVTEDGENITVERNGELQGTDVTTAPYPGFPTDMHPQVMVLLCLAGKGSVVEEIWSDRFEYINELKKMDASIERHASLGIRASRVIATGVSKLKGAEVNAMDLRGGAALVLAGLAAEGTTVIRKIDYILRGYDDIVKKLEQVGADIYWENVEE